MKKMMTPWKHRLLAYAILVLLFSFGLYGFQFFLIGKCRDQVADKPALAAIKAIANSNSLAPEIVRGTLEAKAPPTNAPALAEIWTLAKQGNVSKYEVSFYLTEPKDRMNSKGIHLILLSQAVSVGFVVGAYGLVYAVIGALAGRTQERKPKKAQLRRPS
jgi:hypothetical protein